MLTGGFPQRSGGRSRSHAHHLQIRQLVTNHFLQFLSLDRSDPKKFQVLQLISALLGWTEGMYLTDWPHRILAASMASDC